MNAGHLKIAEEEVWCEDIHKLSNEELANLIHLYRVRHELLRDELNRRVCDIFPDLSPQQVSSAAPMFKILILERMQDMYK